MRRKKIDPPSNKEPELHSGTAVVAVIDALGFKEARHKHSAAELLTTLRQMKNRGLGEATVHNLFSRENLRFIALSDTMVLVGFPSDGGSLDGALGGIADALCSLVMMAARADVPLAYRGCITVGDVAVQEDFFVGDAIDEAVQWHEQAEAAVVWMTPAGRRRIEIKHRQYPQLFEWSVPLKGTGSVRALALNPLWIRAATLISQAASTFSMDDSITRLLAPFERSDHLDVARKQQNTVDFLSAAERYTEDCYERELDSYIALNQEGPDLGDD